MKRIILSISLFTLFAGTAFPMNSEQKIRSEEGLSFCVDAAFYVLDALELIGVPYESAWEVAQVVYAACQEQNKQ